MNTNYFFESLQYLRPEMAITLFLVVVLSFDLAFPKSKKVLSYLTALGILVAGGFAVNDYLTIQRSIPLMTAAPRLPIASYDALGIFFKILILFSSFFIVIFSEKSKELKECLDRFGEYYSLMLGMILGMLLLVCATDFLLIYLSLELVSLSSYVLAGFLKNSKKSSEASLKYVIFGGVASGIMLFGISILYGMTASTNIFVIAGKLAFSTNPILSVLVALMVFTGIGYKISSVPFHFWTPDVYEGSPITITAFLSVASKAAGFALLIRFIRTVYPIDVFFIQLGGYSVHWKEIIMYLSIMTMTLGNLSALWQDNMKRMLAFSSIAHAGYLMTALTTMNTPGIIAILIYLAVYIVMNLGAFFVVMLIKNEINSEHIDDYNGLGYKMPFYGVMLSIFLVSLTGLPPTAGFIGKLYLFTALLESHMVTLSLIALLNSVISLYYYIRVLKHMYLKGGNDPDSRVSVSTSNIVVTLALAIPIIVLGIYFSPLLEFAKNSATMLGVK